MKLRAPLVVAILALASGDAVAQTDGLRIEWSTPDCEAPAALVQSVLSIAPLDEDSYLTVEVDVQRRDEKLHAAVTSASGARNVSAADCPQLQQAVVVVIALMLGAAKQKASTTPNLSSTFTTTQAKLTTDSAPQQTIVTNTKSATVAAIPPNAAVFTEPAIPTTASTTSTVAQKTAEAPLTYSLSLTASVRGSLGFMPRAALSPVLRLRYARRQVGLQMDLTFMPAVSSQGPGPVTSSFSGGSGGVEFDWFVVGNGRQRRPLVALTGGVELGVIRGRAEGITQPRNTTALAAALLLGAEGHVPIGQLSLWIRLNGALQWLRPEFQVAGLGRLHRVSLLTARGEVGVGYAFF